MVSWRQGSCGHPPFDEVLVSDLPCFYVVNKDDGIAALRSW